SLPRWGLSEQGAKTEGKSGPDREEVGLARESNRAATKHRRALVAADAVSGDDEVLDVAGPATCSTSRASRRSGLPTIRAARAAASAASCHRRVPTRFLRCAGWAARARCQRARARGVRRIAINPLSSPTARWRPEGVKATPPERRT